MNLSAMDIKGGLLIVSQFTIMGDVRHGRKAKLFVGGSAGRGKNYF